MENKIKWEVESNNSKYQFVSTIKGYVGKWHIFSLFYDQFVSLKNKKKHCLAIALPGIKNKIYFETMNQAKDYSLKIWEYWFSHLQSNQKFLNNPESTISKKNETSFELIGEKKDLWIIHKKTQIVFFKNIAPETAKMIMINLNNLPEIWQKKEDDVPINLLAKCKNIIKFAYDFYNIKYR